MEIIPAILPRDFNEIEEKIGLIHGLAKTVQIDVCDGQFTPSASWPYRKRDDDFEKLIHEQEGFPGWEDEDFEIDLMANRPDELVDDWVSAGASRIIIHIESKGDIKKALVILGGRVEIGLALNEDTSLEAVEPYFEHVNFIQLMGIDNIGFQGQAFDEKVIGRIKEVRLKYPTLPISIDGGVSLENARELIAAGADRLVVGSAIFGTDNPTEALEQFKRIN
jgi:ribulose-phosphate 3-epimerase